ncbi:ester cyclase [Rhizobium leguminosarum]
MTINLSDLYQGYIDCLNSQDWDNLGKYVGAEVAYNGEMIGLVAYRQAREREFREIPDLNFKVSILVSDLKTVASRLEFDISPSGEFLGLPVNGKRVKFSENVFYEYEGGKIARVWSVLDKAAIEAQLSRS